MDLITSPGGTGTGTGTASKPFHTPATLPPRPPHRLTAATMAHQYQQQPWSPALTIPSVMQAHATRPGPSRLRAVDVPSSEEQGDDDDSSGEEAVERSEDVMQPDPHARSPYVPLSQLLRQVNKTPDRFKSRVQVPRDDTVTS